MAIGVTAILQFSECSHVFALQGLPLHMADCIKDYAGEAQGIRLIVREVDTHATIVKVINVRTNWARVSPYQLEQRREY